MYDTATRVRMAQHRAQEKRHKWEKSAISRLSILSIVLFGFLVTSFSHLSGGRYGVVQGMSGATMLLQGAGGYVLVGIIAFVLAVTITVLCIRHRGKSGKYDIENNDTEEKTK